LWSYGRPITSGGSPTQQSRPASDRTRPTIPAAPAAPQGNGRTGVGLVRGGGTYTVPVRINGVIELQFTVDSGASDVTIPADVVLTLIRTGTLTSSDFIGEQTYRLADGRTIQSSVFRIRELKVGDKYAYNVRGSVADVQGSLLLGQSFLGQFSRVSFDNANQRLILE
jgi:predicted aspartyl protease